MRLRTIIGRRLSWITIKLFYHPIRTIFDWRLICLVVPFGDNGRGKIRTREADAKKTPLAETSGRGSVRHGVQYVAAPPAYR